MFEASKDGEVEKLMLLLDDSSNANELVLLNDKWGRTALHYAANKEIAQLLVNSVIECDQKALLTTRSPRVRDSEGLLPPKPTALDAAVANGRFDVVEYLLSFSIAHELLFAQEEKLCHICLHYAKSADMVDLLLNAVKSDEMRKKFLLTGNWRNETILHLAVKNGYKEVITYLCNLPDSPELLQCLDVNGNTAYCCTRSRDILQVLVEASPNYMWKDLLLKGNKEKRTVLHGASVLQVPEMVEYLCSLSLTDLITLRDKSGDTALHLAHSLDITQMLIESIPTSVSVELIFTKNNHGRTVLHRFVYWNADISAVEYLLDSVPSVEKLLFVTDNEGRTALHYADTVDMVELLINNVKDELAFLNITDIEGHTALMYMAVRGLPECLRYLLDLVESEFGERDLEQSLLIRNFSGQNVFHLASISPLSGELVEVLQDYINIVRIDEILIPDKFNNTPITYLSARFLTNMFAEFIMRSPPWERREYLHLKNIKGTNCLSILDKREFVDSWYLRDVLCVEEDISYHQRFKRIPFSSKFSVDALFHPEKHIRFDQDILRVLKYALNEYSPLDFDVAPRYPKMAVAGLSSVRDLQKVTN